MHFTHALDAAVRLEMSLPLAALRGRAQALELLGEYELARKDYEQAIRLMDSCRLSLEPIITQRFSFDVSATQVSHPGASIPGHWA